MCLASAVHLSQEKIMKPTALLIVRMLCVGAAIGQSVPQGWTKAVALSTGGEGWESAAAIDAAGNSVAVWDERTTSPFVQDRIWARSRRANGSWGARTIVSPTTNWIQTTYVFPAVRAAGAGNATAIWTDVDGLWTAEMAAN